MVQCGGGCLLTWFWYSSGPHPHLPPLPPRCPAVCWCGTSPSMGEASQNISRWHWASSQGPSEGGLGSGGRGRGGGGK